MNFLVLAFLDEILTNRFVYVDILVFTIQQVCSNKTLLVWSSWPNLSLTLHKTPWYGPGSQLWRANGRGLYLALTTKFPTWCVEGSVWGQLNEGSLGSATWVVYHKGYISERKGIPFGLWFCCTTKSFPENFQQLAIHEMCECAQRHLTTGTLNLGFYSVGLVRGCQEVIVTQLTHKHTYVWRYKCRKLFNCFIVG